VGCAILEQVSIDRGYSKYIKVNNISSVYLPCSGCLGVRRKITLHFSRPGTPTDHARIKPVGRSLREECLNSNGFMSLEDTKENLEKRRNEHNEYRLSSVPVNLPSAGFVRNHAAYGHEMGLYVFLFKSDFFRGTPNARIYTH
jgi:putative transposase